jgi:hypothetical protein
MSGLRFRLTCPAGLWRYVKDDLSGDKVAVLWTGLITFQSEKTRTPMRKVTFVKYRNARLTDLSGDELRQMLIDFLNRDETRFDSSAMSELFYEKFDPRKQPEQRAFLAGLIYIDALLHIRCRETYFEDPQAERYLLRLADDIWPGRIVRGADGVFREAPSAP